MLRAHSANYEDLLLLLFGGELLEDGENNGEANPSLLPNEDRNAIAYSMPTPQPGSPDPRGNRRRGGPSSPPSRGTSEWETCYPNTQEVEEGGSPSVAMALMNDHRRRPPSFNGSVLRRHHPPPMSSSYQPSRREGKGGGEVPDEEEDRRREEQTAPSRHLNRMRRLPALEEDLARQRRHRKDRKEDEEEEGELSTFAPVEHREGRDRWKRRHSQPPVSSSSVLLSEEEEEEMSSPPRYDRSLPSYPRRRRGGPRNELAEASHGSPSTNSAYAWGEERRRRREDSRGDAEGEWRERPPVEGRPYPTRRRREEEQLRGAPEWDEATEVEGEGRRSRRVRGHHKGGRAPLLSSSSHERGPCNEEEDESEEGRGYPRVYGRRNSRGGREEEVYEEAPVWYAPVRRRHRHHHRHRPPAIYGPSHRHTHGEEDVLDEEAEDEDTNEEEEDPRWMPVLNTRGRRHSRNILHFPLPSAATTSFPTRRPPGFLSSVSGVSTVFHSAHPSTYPPSPTNTQEQDGGEGIHFSFFSPSIFSSLLGLSLATSLERTVIHDYQEELHRLWLPAFIAAIQQRAAATQPAFPPLTGVERKELEFQELSTELVAHLAADGIEECTVCQERFQDIWNECEDYARCPSLPSLHASSSRSNSSSPEEENSERRRRNQNHEGTRADDEAEAGEENTMTGAPSSAEAAAPQEEQEAPHVKEEEEENRETMLEKTTKTKTTAHNKEKEEQEGEQEARRPTAAHTNTPPPVGLVSHPPLLSSGEEVAVRESYGEEEETRERERERREGEEGRPDNDEDDEARRLRGARFPFPLALPLFSSSSSSVESSSSPPPPPVSSKYHRRHDVLICRLPCNHFFCRDCLLRWMAYTSTCPNCRLLLKDVAIKYVEDEASRPWWWEGKKDVVEVHEEGDQNDKHEAEEEEEEETTAPLSNASPPSSFPAPAAPPSSPDEISCGVAGDPSPAERSTDALTETPPDDEGDARTRRRGVVPLRLPCLIERPTSLEESEMGREGLPPPPSTMAPSSPFRHPRRIRSEVEREEEGVTTPQRGQAVRATAILLSSEEPPPEEAPKAIRGGEKSPDNHRHFSSPRGEEEMGRQRVLPPASSSSSMTASLRSPLGPSTTTSSAVPSSAAKTELPMVEGSGEEDLAGTPTSHAVPQPRLRIAEFPHRHEEGLAMLPSSKEAPLQSRRNDSTPSAEGAPVVLPSSVVASFTRPTTMIPMPSSVASLSLSTTTSTSLQGNGALLQGGSGSRHTPPSVSWPNGDRQGTSGTPSHPPVLPTTRATAPRPGSRGEGGRLSPLHPQPSSPQDGTPSMSSSSPPSHMVPLGSFSTSSSSLAFIPFFQSRTSSAAAGGGEGERSSSGGSRAEDASLNASPEVSGVSLQRGGTRERSGHPVGRVALPLPDRGGGEERGSFPSTGEDMGPLWTMMMVMMPSSASSFSASTSSSPPPAATGGPPPSFGLEVPRHGTHHAGPLTPSPATTPTRLLADAPLSSSASIPHHLHEAEDRIHKRERRRPGEEMGAPSPSSPPSTTPWILPRALSLSFGRRDASSPLSYPGARPAPHHPRHEEEENTFRPPPPLFAVPMKRSSHTPLEGTTRGKDRSDTTPRHTEGGSEETLTRPGVLSRRSLWRSGSPLPDEVGTRRTSTHTRGPCISMDAVKKKKAEALEEEGDRSSATHLTAKPFQKEEANPDSKDFWRTHQKDSGPEEFKTKKKDERLGKLAPRKEEWERAEHTPSPSSIVPLVPTRRDGGEGPHRSSLHPSGGTLPHRQSSHHLPINPSSPSDSFSKNDAPRLRCSRRDGRLSGGSGQSSLELLYSHTPMTSSWTVSARNTSSPSFVQTSGHATASPFPRPHRPRHVQDQHRPNNASTSEVFQRVSRPAIVPQDEEEPENEARSKGPIKAGDLRRRPEPPSSVLPSSPTERPPHAPLAPTSFGKEVSPRPPSSSSSASLCGTSSSSQKVSRREKIERRGWKRGSHRHDNETEMESRLQENRRERKRKEQREEAAEVAVDMTEGEDDPSEEKPYEEEDSHHRHHSHHPLQKNRPPALPYRRSRPLRRTREEEEDGGQGRRENGKEFSLATPEETQWETSKMERERRRRPARYMPMETMGTSRIEEEKKYPRRAGREDGKRIVEPEEDDAGEREVDWKRHPPMARVHPAMVPHPSVRPALPPPPPPPSPSSALPSSTGAAQPNRKRHEPPLGVPPLFPSSDARNRSIPLTTLPHPSEASETSVRQESRTNGSDSFLSSSLFPRIRLAAPARDHTSPPHRLRVIPLPAGSYPIRSRSRTERERRV